MARKLKRSEIRIRRREQRAAKPEMVAESARPIEEQELRQKVCSLVAQLKEPCRSAIRLHFFQGLSPQELAKRLGISIESAYKRIQRAVALLREKLDRNYRGREFWVAALLPIAKGRGGLPPARRWTWAAAAALLLPAALLTIYSPENPPSATLRTSRLESSGGLSESEAGGKERFALESSDLYPTGALPSPGLRIGLGPRGETAEAAAGNPLSSSQPSNQKLRAQRYAGRSSPPVAVPPTRFQPLGKPARLEPKPVELSAVEYQGWKGSASTDLPTSPDESETEGAEEPSDE